MGQPGSVPINPDMAPNAIEDLERLSRLWDWNWNLNERAINGIWNWNVL